MITIKRFLAFLILGTACTIFLKAQDNNIAFNNALNKALNDMDFLTLNKEYTSLPTKVHPMMDLLAQACIKCAFNQPAEGVEKIDSLFYQYAQELNNPYFIKFFMPLRLAQLEKLAKWDECVKTIKSLEPYKKNDSLFSTSVIDQYQALENIKFPNSVIVRKSKKSHVKMTSEQIPNIKECWTVPVKANNETGTFIFDTGASKNTVSEKFAKRNNVKVIADSILIPTAVSPTYSKIGIIDKLTIGDIEYQNLIVYIMDFSFLNKNLKYEIDGVLGTPFMNTVGKIEILPQKRIINFPENIEYPNHCMQPNMFYVGSELLTEAYLDSIRSILTIDTGNICEGQINYPFLQKNINLINQYVHGTDTVKVGGVQGIDTLYYYKINIPVSINNVTVKSKDFRGIKNEKMIGIKDGVLGVEFFNKCKRILFDFENMILNIE